MRALIAMIITITALGLIFATDMAYELSFEAAMVLFVILIIAVIGLDRWVSSD